MSQKIVIVNGNSVKGETPFNHYLNEIKEELVKEGSRVEIHELLEQEIKSCCGCWDCWWKTPGTCRYKDDVPELLKSVINSDMVIYSSPLIMGMYSALLKRFHDRTVSLVHPYIEIQEGECHHQKRYPKYPKMGVIVDEKDATSEEIENVKYTFDRIALNFHSEVKFFKSFNQISSKELSHEINHL